MVLVRVHRRRLRFISGAKTRQHRPTTKATTTTTVKAKTICTNGCFTQSREPGTGRHRPPRCVDQKQNLSLLLGPYGNRECMYGEHACRRLTYDGWRWAPFQYSYIATKYNVPHTTKSYNFLIVFIAAIMFEWIFVVNPSGTYGCGGLLLQCVKHEMKTISYTRTSDINILPNWVSFFWMKPVSKYRKTQFEKMHARLWLIIYIFSYYEACNAGANTKHSR